MDTTPSQPTPEDPFITLRSGLRLHPFNPRPGEFILEDIAWGLAHKCRYSGQSAAFYSVAEHSVLALALLEPSAPWEVAMATLLHDSAEAFLADISRPVKKTEAFAEFRRIEDNLLGCIFEAFGLPFRELPAAAKEADTRAGNIEWAFLMHSGGLKDYFGIYEIIRPFGPSQNALDHRGHAIKPLRCWEPSDAAEAFTQTFRLLANKRPKNDIKGA